MTTGAIYVQFLAHTRTAWTTTEGDPIIDQGRLVFEDQGSGVYKALLGDGVTHYSSLSYIAATGSVAWGGITGTLSSQSDLNTALSGKQASDSDLTAIAGLSPSNDDVVQRKAGAWTNRTPAQLKTDLAITEADVASLVADLAAKAPLASPTFSGTVTLPTGLTGIAKMASGVVSAVAAPSGAIVGDTDTQTLTNKRVSQRTNSISSNATPTISIDDYDQFNITALAVAITSVTITGTPTAAQKLVVRIKDNGTARAIAWGSQFTSSGVATLLSTTVISKTHMSLFVWDAIAALWVCMAVDATGY